MAVLFGGDSSEREISLLSGKAVLDGTQAARRRCPCLRPARPGARRSSWRSASSACGSRCTARAARTARCRARSTTSACPTPGAGSWARPSAWTSCVPSAWPRPSELRPRTSWCCAGLQDFATALERLGLPLIVKPATQGSVGRHDQGRARRPSSPPPTPPPRGSRPSCSPSRGCPARSTRWRSCRSEALPSIRIETPQDLLRLRGQVLPRRHALLLPRGPHRGRRGAPGESRARRLRGRRRLGLGAGGFHDGRAPRARSCSRSTPSPA